MSVASSSNEKGHVWLEKAVQEDESELNLSPPASIIQFPFSPPPSQRGFNVFIRLKIIAH
jgi:hypothetical protein